MESPEGPFVDHDASPDHPFTTSLRKGIQLQSKEALCLLGLKKKIARLYAENIESEDSIYDQTFGKKSGKKRQADDKTPPEETKPVKRKRGRPPKIKQTKEPEPKQKPSTQPSKTRRAKIVKAKEEDEVTQPPRRSRSAKRPAINDPSDSEAEDPPCQMNDEQLALQLHLDLNAPKLRKRRRSGGLLSPSSSEQ